MSKLNCPRRPPPPVLPKQLRNCATYDPPIRRVALIPLEERALEETGLEVQSSNVTTVKSTARTRPTKLTPLRRPHPCYPSTN